MIHSVCASQELYKDKSHSSMDKQTRRSSQVKGGQWNAHARKASSFSLGAKQSLSGGAKKAQCCIGCISVMAGGTCEMRCMMNFGSISE